MPGAVHSICDHQAFHERTAVMRAVGSDRKYFALAAHQQDLVITDSSYKLAAVCKLSRGDALREIGPNCCVWFLRHGLILVEGYYCLTVRRITLGIGRRPRSGTSAA